MDIQKIVNNWLTYDPETGFFYWKKSKPPRGIAGSRAGYYTGHGYRKISINGKQYLEHRLAFLIQTGELPTGEIDHINQCGLDNSWSNLRLASRQENCANVAGAKGIRFRYGKWYARYADNHIGVFSNKEDAFSAYKKVKTLAASGADPFLKNVSKDIETVKQKYVPKLFDGKTLSEWGRVTGIKQVTLWHRINKQGMSLSEALRI